MRGTTLTESTATAIFKDNKQVPLIATHNHFFWRYEGTNFIKVLQPNFETIVIQEGDWKAKQFESMFNIKFNELPKLPNNTPKRIYRDKNNNYKKLK